MTDESKFENPTSPLLRVPDVARRLNISRSLAYQLLQQGVIPYVKIGKLVRICESDLEEYILRCRMVDRCVFMFDAKINV